MTSRDHLVVHKLVRRSQVTREAPLAALDQILGVPVRVTSPARTVVDCFRYRHKLGLDVALEALREAIRARATNTDEIMRAAEVCRARTVVRTYLEALTL